MSVALNPHRSRFANGAEPPPWHPTPGLSVHTEMISPPRARSILSDLNWARQRDISPSWILALKAAMGRGELTFLTLTFAQLPGVPLSLVDGQHRLTALAALEATMPAAVVTHDVIDEEALGKLYLTYDRSRARGPVVALRALGVLDDTELPVNFVRRLGGGVNILRNRFSRSYRQDRSLIARSDAVKDWLPEIAAYRTALLGAPRDVEALLLRSTVGAVALATFRYQPEVAAEFWSRVASQEMLAAEDPRRILLIWLRSHRAADLGNEIGYCAYIAGAWNAYSDGRSLKILKITDPMAPVHINGTPYGNPKFRQSGYEGPTR